METNTYPIAEHLQHFGRRPLSTILLERDALARGLSTLRVGPWDFIAWDQHGRSVPFSRTASALAQRPAAPITRNKHSTRLVLQRAGVPVPQGRRFTPADVEQAQRYASQLGFPVVVKPLEGMEGKGVVTDIMSSEDIAWAFENLKRTAYAKGDVVVEEQIRGEAYRFVVMDGDVISVLYKRRGRIIGDGMRSVSALIDEKQQQRRMNPHLLSRPLHVDEVMERLVASQGHSLFSVPAAGEEILITYGSNTHQGGEHTQVMDKIHPSFMEASVRAVRAIPGMTFGGVDFLIEDPGRPLDDQRAAICEVNSVPGADTHEYPLAGEPRPVTKELLTRSAAKEGVQLGEEVSEVAVDVQIRGRFKDDAFLSALSERAEKLGVTGTTAMMSRTLVRGVWCGTPHMVSVLISSAQQGGDGARVRSIRAEQVETGKYSRFTIGTAGKEKTP
ncbi:acylphosphatase [Nesterenkonia alba]|uniref:ATP-binding protein n=1 Tax=Nesterenkonia alba TaxID=515814 RepID=UPI0004197C02|nr:acylphosphatase [Nesterenkonia alba]